MGTEKPTRGQMLVANRGDQGEDIKGELGGQSSCCLLQFLLQDLKYNLCFPNTFWNKFGRKS